MAKGVMVCLCILDRWHCRHDCAHIRTSALMLGHTYWLVTRHSVARTPGWERQCSLSNTARLNGAGTTGRGSPVERWQTMVVVEAGIGTLLSWREEVDCSDKRVWSSACAFAIASKSISWCCLSALTSTRDRASATGLLTPLTCRMSEVN